MRGPAAFFPIVLALGAIILAPRASAQAQDSREEGRREIEKCQTISQPGSYKLVRNLTFTGPVGGTCLSITASFVTIDLAGFTISGPVVPGPGFPFPATTAIAAGDNITGIGVRNGSISGFSVGVALGVGSIVEGLRVSEGTLTGIAATGIVRGNTVVGIADGPGQGVGISATGIITGNYVSGSRGTGMEIGEFRLGGSTVIGNTVVNGIGQSAFGISVSCPSNVIDNTAVNNPGPNLVLNGEGCNNTNNVAP
jgi:hypothetical protein